MAVVSKILFLLVAPGSELPTDSLEGIQGVNAADLVIGVKSEQSISMSGGELYPGRIYKIRDGLGMGQAMIRRHQVGLGQPRELDGDALEKALVAFDEAEEADSIPAAIRAYLDALE